MHQTYNRAIEEYTSYNRAVEDAHCWLVDHAQWIYDEIGVTIPIDFYTLRHMRSLKARYGDYRRNNIDSAPPSELDRQMMSEYDALMRLYANRNTEDEYADHFGSWAMIVAILAPWLIFAVVYIIWK